jgi:polyhydroxyalkanoate synthase
MSAPAAAKTSPLPALGAVDLAAYAALDARYRPQWEALWHAAQSALAAPTATMTAFPEIVATPPGDHRFDGRAWHEFPYFALLRQSYLLASAYLTELAALAQLPEHDKQRLGFIVRQYIDALAPTNFAATNPEVIERALATDGLSIAQGLTNLATDFAQAHLDERRARLRSRP